MSLDGDDDEAADSGEVAVAPARRGRRPGSKNKRTIEVELALRPMLPRAKRKLAELLQSDDPETAYKALALTFGYIFGKPTERVSAELSGPDGQPIETRELGHQEAARRIAFLLASAHQHARAAGAPSLIEGDAERVTPSPLPAPAPIARPAYTPPPPPSADEQRERALAESARLASLHEDAAFARRAIPHVISRRPR